MPMFAADAQAAALPPELVFPQNTATVADKQEGFVSGKGRSSPSLPFYPQSLQFLVPFPNLMALL